MKLLFPIAVFLLMVSIGMSLRPSHLWKYWRGMIGGNGLRLLLATFIVPPAVALLLYHLLPLDFGEGVGLFMLGVVPELRSCRGSQPSAASTCSWRPATRFGARYWSGDASDRGLCFGPIV